jgi:hypothetical protein
LQAKIPYNDGENTMFWHGGGMFSIFHNLGRIQAKVARLRKFSGYGNPADIFPPVAWYDAHAAR